MKEVIPESEGLTVNESTVAPVESCIETLRLEVPAGALTAAPIAPPVARVAVVPGARIECPIRLVPFMMEEACMEACMLCIADTWLMPSNCVTNWVGSDGESGF